MITKNTNKANKTIRRQTIYGELFQILIALTESINDTKKKQGLRLHISIDYHEILRNILRKLYMMVQRGGGQETPHGVENYDG